MPSDEKKKPWATVVVGSPYAKTGKGMGYGNGYLTELTATQACDQANAMAEKMELAVRYVVVEVKSEMAESDAGDN